MDFWWGLIIGAFGGANIGIVMAGLCAASKREETGRDFLWDQLHMDQAVMDTAPVETARAGRAFPGASADPVPHF